MKKFVAVLLMAALLMLAACGVSQAEHDRLQSEMDMLQDELRDLRRSERNQNNDGNEPNGSPTVYDNGVTRNENGEVRNGNGMPDNGYNEPINGTAQEEHDRLQREMDMLRDALDDLRRDERIGDNELERPQIPGLPPTTQENGEPERPGTVQNVRVGEIIQFGATDWRVLEVDGNRALLLHETIVANQPYHQPGGAITWEGSTLRE